MEINADDVTTPNQETNKILNNIFKKCKMEAENNKLQIPLEDVEDRVSYYTGIPKITLHQILNKNTTDHNSIDFRTHLIILKCLNTFYERKELPSFSLLLDNVNEFFRTLDVQCVKDVEQFKQEVTMLGIDYQTIFNDTKLLMEDPKITFERYSYLKKIKQIRQENGYAVYYIGERIIEKNYMFNNPWIKNGQASEMCSGKYILFHAVSKFGLTNGLFCFSATEDDFYKWVVDILLGSLCHSSVVVLDNSPLHGTSRTESVTMFDTKSDLKRWLRKRNVPVSDAMNKSQLYQLVKYHADIEQMPRVDRVIKANGHQVLRLPTHFENLSPLEHIWHDIKSSLEGKDDLHDEILSIFENMPRDSYELYEADIAERENAMFLIDTEMDKVLDNFLLDLKNTTSDPASSSSSA